GAMPGPDRWLSWRSDRCSLSGLTAESTSTPWVGAEAEHLDVQDPERSADNLARLGVTHVVAPTPALADKLAAAPRFAPVWSMPRARICAVQPGEGWPPPASLVATERPARARLVDPEPEHPRFEVALDAPARATLAVAWSPRWHGTRDGTPQDLVRT